MGKGCADVERMVVVKRKRNCSIEASVQEFLVPHLFATDDIRLRTQIKIIDWSETTYQVGHSARLVSESYANQVDDLFNTGQHEATQMLAHCRATRVDCQSDRPIVLLFCILVHRDSHQQSHRTVIGRIAVGVASPSKTFDAVKVSVTSNHKRCRTSFSCKNLPRPALSAGHSLLLQVQYSTKAP